MSKKLTFTVTVEFADKIVDDNEVLEVANNIAKAIVNDANTIGIAPEESETHTESVEVKPQFVDEGVNLKVY